MQVKIYWITELYPGRIGIMSRPRGGDWLEDEICSLSQSKVDAVISLLERDEIIELDLEKEEVYCQKHSIVYHSFSIPDRQIPSSIRDAQKFIQRLTNLLSEGKSLVIHCRQGIGRSSMIAACALVRSGFSVGEAFEKIELARGCQVPDTQEQRAWVVRFCENF